MVVARASRSGLFLLAAATAALFVPAVPGAAGVTPPPLGSACTIEGTTGADTLDGTPGDDVICGYAGDDTIDGKGGDDLIIGGAGDDNLLGGDGADDIRGGTGTDTLTGNVGNDLLYGDGGNDSVDGSEDDDVVTGGAGDDTLTGGLGADTLWGQAGLDTGNGGDGNDKIDGGTDADVLHGNVGVDQVNGAGGDDDLYGDEDGDVLRGGSGNDEHFGGTGDDTIFDQDGAGFADTVTCGDGAGDAAFVDTFDSVNVDCESNKAIDRDDPVAVNDAKTVLEDAVHRKILVLANDTDADGGPIKVASATDPAHGTVTIAASRKHVYYTPDPNYCNTPPGTTPDTFDYTLSPGGSTATVSVKVACRLDNPVANDDSATVLEDDAATTIDVLGNDTDNDSAGLGILSTTDPAHGTVAITNGGADLTYTPDPNYCNDGLTTDDFDYTLTNGGDTGTVKVTVTCVQDDPIATNDTKTVLEDAAATTINVLSNDSDAEGDAFHIQSTTDPAHGTVAITNGGADLTYTPDPNYCNDPPGNTPDTFDYTLTPGTNSATVEVTVTCVNDVPVADDESFTTTSSAVGNTVLVVDDPTDGAPSESGPHKSITGDILAGDTDLETPGALAVTATTITTADGGSVVMQADGDFVFTPKAGTSCTDHTDSFNYTLNDGDGGTDTGTVTIDIAGCVWYVSNNAAGNSGTSNAPFDTLAQADAISAVNDTIYVFDGDNTTTGYAAGITLKAGQRLIGERASLDVGSDHLADAVAGNRPTITAGGADVVTLAAGNVLTGIAVDPGTAGGIAGGAGDAGGTIADVAVNDSDTSGTQPGLELDTTSGAYAISDFTVNNAGATGIRLNGNTGTVTFASTGTISVVTTGAKALDFNATNLGTSVFDTVASAGALGNIAILNTTGSVTFSDLNLTTSSGSAGGFVVSNATGVTVAGAGTANVNTTGGPAVDVVNSPGAALTFNGVSSNNSANDGVNIDSIGTGTFSAAAGTISGAAGIAFDLNGGSGNVTYPGALNNGAGATAEVTGRSGGNVLFSGPVADTNDAGGGITVQSNTGGTTTFSNPSKKVDSGAFNAIAFTSSDGHTLSFTNGGLDVDTTSGNGLLASSSGTLAVGGSGNTIDTGTGAPAALSVSATDIGASGLTFQHVTAFGGGTGANGIVLNGTGTSGSLNVTGVGGTCTIADTSGCTGGTISGFTGSDTTSLTPAGAGIVLNSTKAPTFARIHVDGDVSANDNYGIRGNSVDGFTLTDSVVEGTLGTSAVTANKDGAIRFGDDNTSTTGLTGTVTMTNVAISGGYFTNLMVDNFSGTLNATLDNVDSLALDDTGGDDAVQFEGTTTADMNLTYKNSSLTDASGDLFQYIADGTGGGDLTLTGDAFSNNEPSIVTGGGGLAVVGGAKGAVTLNIANNTMKDSKTNALTVIKSRDAAAGSNNLTATITNNDIGLSGTANSGSAEGDGMEISTFGDGNASFTVTNNDIRQYNSSGIQFIAGGGIAESGQLNLNVSGNTVQNPGTTPTITLLQGIRVDSGVVAGDNFATCVKYGANSITGSSDAANKDFRLFAFHSPIRQPGYGGGNTDVTAFANYAAALIGGGSQGTAFSNSAGDPTAIFSGAGTTCP